MIKAIVFDCWNTLFYDDSKKHPFEEFAQTLGYSFKNPIFARTFEKHFMQENFTDFKVPTNKLLNDVGIDPTESLESRINHIFERFEYLERKAFPEVLNTLEKLMGNYKLVLVTNTTKRGFEILNRKFGLDKKFDLILKSCDLGILKPHHKIFELILEKLNLKKDEVVVVGDNLETDVLAAEEFGIRGILVDRKMKHMDFPNSINTLEELFPKLKRL